MHVTLRARRSLGSLRTQVPFAAILAAIKLAHKDGFAVVHYSVQRDHLHLMVEAGTTRELSAGMRSLAIRIAKALNRSMKRKGSVWADRWHGRALTSPREVRNCLVYVLFNGQKHRELARGLDPYASALWIPDALQPGPKPHCPCRRRAPPVARAATWLLASGWQRHGLLGPADAAHMAAVGLASK